MKKKKIKTVLIIGTLDTKAEEIFFTEKLIKKKDFNAVIMDIGIIEYPIDEVIHQKTSKKIINARNKPLSEYPKNVYMNEVINEGKILCDSLYHNDEIDGILGIGGGTGASIATAIMQAIPRGLPKLMVSPIATGTTQFGPFVGTSDITIMHSVVDLQGINFFTTQILSNAVGAICGMIEEYHKETIKVENSFNKSKTHIALSMMGTTTKGALKAKKLLEKNGFEVISFHQNGTGGIAMEEMIKEGIFQGVFDLSIHEVAGREVGGLHGAIKSIRLETAGKKGIPQVVVPGCIVYYVAGSLDSLVPKVREKRKYFIHSPEATLVRITPKELIRIGKVVAKKLNLAKGPLKIFIPLKGFCSPDKKGSELFEPEGNIAFINSLKKDLDKHIPIVEVNAHINDTEFIEIVTKEFIKIMKEGK